MPVFEYKCAGCGEKYEVLVKSAEKEGEVSCPRCNSKDNRKLFSAFSAKVSASPGNYDSCGDGSCNPQAGGCASGMCGMN